MLNVEFRGSSINMLCEDTNKQMNEVRKSIQDLGREASNMHVKVRNEDQECGLESVFSGAGIGSVLTGCKVIYVLTGCRVIQYPHWLQGRRCS